MACSRYLYELERFGWCLDKVVKVQAFHFKGGQGAKTGTGGHLPGAKVVGKIAEVRGLEPGLPAVSPSRFPDLQEPADFRRVAGQVRERAGGIPIGFNILDGRGGGTGAAAAIFKDNISIPTMVALARAREHLDARGSATSRS